MSKTANGAMDDVAYQRIWELALNHKLVPGQKIVYRDLESQLGMSKTPILHALSRLKNENIVRSIHNRGYYMKNWAPKDIFQMFEVKTKIYDIVVDCALVNCTSTHLSRLRKAMNDYARYKCEIYDVTKFRLDLAFHLRIVEMACNDYLASILEQQYNIMAYAMDLSLFSPFLEQFERDHMNIFRAMEAGDAMGAKRVLRAHNRIGQRVAIRRQKGTR